MRVASAAVLAPLGLTAIWFGGRVWEVVLAVIAVGLGFEWAGLCGIGAASLRGFLVPASLLTVGLVAAFLSAPAGLLVLLASALITAAASSRYAAGGGVLYIGAGYLSLLILRHAPRGFADVLLVVLVVWACDIGAYIFGRLLGGPRLAPRLSPSKTWSGALGGLLCGTCVGVAVAIGFGTLKPFLLTAALLAAALSVISQAGDLLESAIKRRFGKKDSSRIIPGHGGLLDRLDGLIAAAPAAFIISLLCVPGGALWDWGKP